MTDEQRKICLRAIDHFGVDHQKEKAVEELLELGTEIMHDLDGRARMDAIREELADVIIMAEQLRIIYGGRYVDEWIDRKLVRLEKKIGGGS
jgi:NTP pyrophosphatase (non-canonical NTP hydrolase)